MAGCAMKGQKGNRDSRLWSPTAECQTNQLALGPPSVSSVVSARRNVACEMEADRNDRSHGYCWGLGRGGALRPYCCLAGRSLAAMLVVVRSVRARWARTGNAVTVRAARGAQRRGWQRHLPFFRTGSVGARPVSSGLVSFDDFGMQWNGGGIFAAAMERNGRRQTDESGQAAGRTVRILGVRHERKCPLCEGRGVCLSGTPKLPAWA